MILALSLLAGVSALAGCGSGAIKANQEQLAQQQKQLDQLKQQIAALQAQNAAAAATPTAPTAGGCDETVLREASRKGGDRFAANDLAQAVVYYQDAVSACPESSRAQLNLARAFEAEGDTAQARTHYGLAASVTRDDGSASEARQALARLGH